MIKTGKFARGRRCLLVVGIKTTRDVIREMQNFYCAHRSTEYAS